MATAVIRRAHSESPSYSLNDHIEDHLPEIEVPVLIVRGQCDPICRGDSAERLTQLLPRGRLVEIPKVAHTLVYTAPVELAAVTRYFLADHATGNALPAGDW